MTTWTHARTTASYDLPGADPEGTCSFGCYEAPACITSHSGPSPDDYDDEAP